MILLSFSNHFLNEEFAFNFYSKSSLRSGSSRTLSALIGVKYRNYGQTLDAYLLFAILLGQIKSKLNYRLVTYKLASP